MIPNNLISKKSPITIAVFLFPALVATVAYGGSTIYLLLLLFGLFLGWPAWQSLELWEKKVLLGFSVFFILISLSLLNTQDYYGGLKKLARYGLFPLFIPMYLLLKRYQIETGKAYLYGCLLASLVLFGQASYQMYMFYQTHSFNWNFKVPGAYNSIIFGDSAMLVLAIVVCALLTVAKNWQHYLLSVVVIGLALSASVMSGARGAWVLLPVLFVWFLWVKRKNLRPIHLISTVIIGFLLSYGLLNLNQVEKRVVPAIKQYQDYSQNIQRKRTDSVGGSVGSRFNMWRDSITIWRVHPLIGTGIGDFRIDQAQLIDKGLSKLDRTYGDAHNIYFDALATSGLVGLFALMVFVQVLPFLMFLSFWKKEKDPWIQFYSLSGMTTIIAFAVFGLTSVWLARNPLLRTYLMTILVFMSSIAIVKQKKAS